MEPIPLPSHVHYELLLQLLERQTLPALNPRSPLKEPVQELIATLRKALAQQKNLEDICQKATLSVDYRWSLNLELSQAETALNGDTHRAASPPTSPNYQQAG
jgi:hypothetical protein